MKIFVQWPWKVFWNIEYRSYLDIPNLENIYLPDSFQKVQSKSITSIDWLTTYDSFIDVSPILADLVIVEQ